MASGLKAKKGKKSITTRGGYEAGPKSVSELKPPPRTLGAGAKAKDDSDTK